MYPEYPSNPPLSPYMPYRQAAMMGSRAPKEQLVKSLKTAMSVLETTSRLLPLIAKIQPMLSNAKETMQVIKALTTSQ